MSDIRTVSSGQLAETVAAEIARLDAALAEQREETAQLRELIKDRPAKTKAAR